MKRFLYVIVLIALMLTLYLTVSYRCQAKGVVDDNVSASQAISDDLSKDDVLDDKESSLKDTVQIVAVGDIMMGTIYPNREFLPRNDDCSRSFSMVKQYFENADIVFGNLEGALTDSRESAKKCNNPDICYVFGMPTKYVECLVSAGFNLMSLANNHSGDFGEAGRKSTVQTLKNAGIYYAGLTDCPTAEFEIEGIKYGFCAFAPNRGTINVKDIPAAQVIVKELKERCDIVIISFHAGAEGRGAQHVTRKTETYLGEDRGNVYEFARRMIDAGADVLLGHGPHVTRAVDIYKNRFIAYSMGNFSTFSRVNVQGISGVAPILRIYTTRNGEFIKAHITPTWQPNEDRTPRLDPQNRAISIIQNLTKTDFPELKINISDDGWVTYNKE